MSTATNKKTLRKRTANPLLKEIVQTGVTLYRDGNRVFTDDKAMNARLDDAVCALVLPTVTDEERQRVQALLAGITVCYVADDAVAVQAVTELSDNEVIALDTETEVLPAYRQPVTVSLTKTGTVAVRQPKDGAVGYALDPRRARVRLVQTYAGADRVYVFDLRYVSWSTLSPLFECDLAMFNAVFDIKMVLASGGPEPAGRVLDTQTAMRLLAPCERWPIGLDAAAQELLDVDVPKGLGSSDWSAEVLNSDQINYAALDPVVTYRLWLAQLAAFDEIDRNAQEISDECLVAVARMELAGIPVDVDRHRQFIAEWEDSLSEAQNALSEATGGGLSGDPTPNEVRAYLTHTLAPDALENWPRTGKTDALAVDQKTFRVQGGGVPGLVELATVRAWQKALSTYGESLLGKADNGRIYARFLVAGARTGRFSSRDPNLQNLPKRSRLLSAFREIFRAPLGYQIVAADYSQIELRIAAAVTGDVTMGEAYYLYGTVHRDETARAQFDIHTTTARGLRPGYDNAAASEQKRARTLAKACNFGLLYGMGWRGFQRYVQADFGIELSDEDAEDAVDVFKDTYEGLAEWQEEQRSESRHLGYAATVGGRRWYWSWRKKHWGDPALDDLEDWQVDSALEGFEATFSLNLPIQGTAAEIMQLALAYVDQALRPYDARIVATVHDELVLVVRDDPETIRAVRRILVAKMTRAWLEFFPDAPYRGIVDVGAGNTWATSH